MVELGYALSSEEHAPNDLVRYAQRAEESGFSFAMISDHFHPWIDKQGQSPFVWATLGALAHETTRLWFATGVTCPIMRIHPIIIAQAAATIEAMMPGRFILGVGTGEALNEHITGEHWPPIHVRERMLEEAVEILRQFWQGGMQDFEGEFYTVENAQIFTLPPQPPRIYVAAGGQDSAEMAGRIGDGFIATSPEKQLVETFSRNGGGDKPRIGQYACCYAADEATARKIAFEYWPTGAVTGQLSQDLPTPSHFEQAVQMLSEDQVAQSLACGPDPRKHLEQIQKFTDAGFTHVYVHNVGPDQESFFRFYSKEVMPKVQ